VQITTEAVPTARGPWRLIGALALIGILIAVAAVAYVGSRPPEPALPAPPFGLAANGSIVIEQAGDILRIDRDSGQTTPLIAGPEVDARPAFSPDGAKLAFERTIDEASGLKALMVADPDGSNAVQATVEPLMELHSWGFAPDGDSLLGIARLDGRMRIFVRPLDPQTEATVLDVALANDLGNIEGVTFRPTNDQEILVVAPQDATGRRGVYVYELATDELRTVYAPPYPYDVFGAGWSPTGDRISFGRFSWEAEGTSARAHVVAADGSGLFALDDAPGTTFDIIVSRWSNDGTRMLITRGPDGTAGEKTLVVSTTGDGEPVELACGATTDVRCPGEWTWSPDDTMLIGTIEGGGYLQADPDTGQVTELDWDASSPPAWQRVAP
jgi:Tol biopolymer transport system component